MIVRSRASIVLAVLALTLDACADGAESEPIARESAPLKRAVTVCAGDCDYHELQPAIDGTVSGEIIRVYQGHYQGPLVIKRAVTIRGDGRSDTVVTGGVTAACTAPADVILEGLAIVDGGGVVNQGCRLKVRNALISGHAVHGSGAGISNASQLILADVEVVSNTARVAGGGLYNAAGATAELRDTTFRSNTAGGAGGAIANAGDLTIRDSLLRDNRAKLGGALSNDGTALVRDSDVLANAAAVEGGGIENGGTLRLRGSRVARNEAERSGGGVSNRAGATFSSLDSSIRNNRPDDCVGTGCP